MNRSESEDGRHEIIIVRRGGHDEDEPHHGGVWKIAFADFMTAMMCFFLVMWLVNAANEQTRSALASYFNPVKLIDRNTNRKGIDDLGKGPQTSSAAETAERTTDRPVASRRALTGPSEEKNATDLSEVPKHSDKNLFADPYAVLAEIVADTGRLQNISPKGEGGAHESGPATGASGGDSYRDPFAPDFWSTQVEVPPPGETAQKSIPEGDIAQVAPEKPTRFTEKEDDPFAPAKPDEPVAPPEEDVKEVAEILPEPTDSAAQPAGQAAEPATAAEPAPREPALAESIRNELAQVFGGEENLKGITVDQSDAGVTISVADDIQDGMFEIGSAVPRRDLVRAMEKIGKTLAAHNGTITINGHTDGRPFAGGDYDNWRLSTARAHATYYMLVRGGLAEDRITGVAGFADRRLKRADDPFASVNRRIEILLGAPG